MGIPSFFRKILKDNEKIIRGMSPRIESFDYFFIDFNSIIYFTFNKIIKKLRKQDDIHQELISETVSFLAHMINDVVMPQKYAFISMDGVAPRAKMVQQRSRRYKSIYLKNILKEKRIEFNENSVIDWDPSANICPGTIFMDKINNALKMAMKTRRFNHRVYLSDSTNPGEGEHKFLKILRDLHFNDATQDRKVVVYSPDGDMISLSLLTHKKNIKIMRIPDKNNICEEKYCKDFEFIALDLNILKEQFFNELTITYSDISLDTFKILNDYNFLLMLVGNDFVVSLPFLKIKSGGLDYLIKIYNEIIRDLKQHLIIYDFKKDENPKINIVFFKSILQRLAMVEGYQMKKIYSQCDKSNDSLRRKQEQEMTPFMIFESRFQHLNFFHPEHPEHDKYIHLLSKINYSQPKHIWKSEFYSYFIGSDVRKDIVNNYFESLQFTLLYYLKSCPSYDWHYRYRVSPLPSDMLLLIDEIDINSIEFKPSYPMLPFEQLMMILPPQMFHLLPQEIENQIIHSGLKKYYPLRFEIDALAGLKYIYSEAILPELDFNQVRKCLNRCNLTNEQMNRNKNITKIYLSK
jgi:5'-3' exonuclease